MNIKKWTSVTLLSALAANTFLSNIYIGQAHAAELTPANHVVVSEVYGGGGNSGAKYTNDFIELYNPTGQDVDLTGWSVQYTSGGGSFSTNRTTLSGSIKAHGYLLVQEKAGSGGTDPLPSADVIGSIALSATAGKVALSKTSDAVSGKADPNVIDYVGFGSSANEFEGTNSTAAPSNSTSVQRKAADGTSGIAGAGNGLDNDDNSNDFFEADPTPQNSSAPAQPSLGPTISEIKAANEDGTLVNEGKTYTVEGTVTVANNIIGANSYYIQDAAGGINVYGDATAVTPGDRVRVTGMLSNYNGLAELTNPKDPADPSKTLPIGVETVGKSPVPAAISSSINDLNAFSSAEPLEGKLVTVTGKVTNVPTKLPGNVTVQDANGKSLTVRVSNTAGIDLASIQGNHTYSFTGLLGQYKSGTPFTTGYQLLPRSTADISEIFPLTLTHEPVTEGVKGADLTIQASATGASSVTVYYKKPADAAFKSVPMTSSDEANYTAVIPGTETAGDSIVYYIQAENQAETKRAGSPEAPFTVGTDTDTTGPVINSEQPAKQAKIESKQPEISVMMNDPSEVDTSKVTISVDNQDLTSKATITADKVLLPINEDLAVGSHSVTVTAADKKGNITEDKWTFEVIPQFTGGNHYRGTTHNHTNISHDAAGNPEDALKAAKVHGYDWFAFSDHSHDIDPEKLGQDTAARSGMPERTGGNEWQTTKDLSNQYTKNDSFVVFPAFEMTSTTWGHSNVFGTDNFIDRNIDGKKYQDLNAYYAWVLTYDNIAAQFNHPDMSANAFNNFMPYDSKVDKLFTMLEVGNGSGNYGYANAEKKFFSALDLGWHIAPTFGEDNHDGTWGQTMKRTVIVSNDLSRNSLLDSMKNMRVYMEEDPNFKLDVLANGGYMGSTIDGNNLSFDIKGSDPVAESNADSKYSFLPDSYKSDDRIQKVELITNGQKVVQSIEPMTKDFTWNPSVPVTGGQQWFVVKITQMDGEKIYSSPIWTKEKPVDVRVSGIDVTGETIVAGSDASLTAGISNLGTKDLTNLNVNFYSDTVDPANKIGNAAIDSLQAKAVKQVSATWKNPPVGDHTIIAVVDSPEGDDAGDNQFSKQVSIKQQLGINVMIDAAHKNENTSTDTGTYKNSFGMFMNLLKKEGYTVTENTNPLTAETLAGVKVLIITHPASDLTAEENKTVSDFVKNGGSLLLTDKSNYKNDVTINNDLLAQMGSTIQFNNDGLNDDTKEGNFWSDPIKSKFAVRLHTEPVANYITDQMPTPSVNFYSGSSLEGIGHTALIDSSTVTILGHGNETSYQGSITGGGYKYDDVSDDHGGSVIPAIASETIGSGKIIVSGMNILNDKQLDESFSPVGNDEFALNSINWLADRGTKISHLNDARTLPEGSAVAVEGTVTSGAGTFYDSFYLQDETGGIMAFQEVPEDSLKPGDKVRVYGHIKKFENNTELEFTSFAKDVIKIGHTEPVAPKVVSTKDSVADENQGLLVKVTGKVVKKYDANSYVINDGSGDVLVFTDGYIVNQTGPVPDLKVGETLEATGLAGKFAEGSRIRVRDTKEMAKVKDAIPPVTEAKVNPAKPDGLNGWYKTDVTVTLAAADDSGEAVKTEYSFDGVDWKAYEAPIIVSSAGKVYYRSTDGDGNQETQKVLEVKIDKTAPVTKATMPSPNSNGWYNKDVTIALEAEDKESGADTVQYRINGGKWTNYSAPIVLSKTIFNKVEYRSTDKAGNTEAVKSVTVNIDKTAPIATAFTDHPLILSPNHKMISVKAFVLPLDLISHIDTVKLESITSNEKLAADDIQGASIGTEDYTFALRADRDSKGRGRVYTITYAVTDKAGNVARVSTTVTVPKGIFGR